MSLWPNTLARFWGAHALAWSAATAFAAASAPVRASALLPSALAAFGGTSLALSVLLYRNREEAGLALAGTAAFYFGGLCMLITAAIRSHRTLLARGALLAFRLVLGWHAALATGAAGFALKASLKDRIFSDGRLQRRGARGTALPLLAFINQQSGAKLGPRVAEALREEASARERDGRQPLQVCDLATVSPVDALRSFAGAHETFRVIVCGGDGTVSWVLRAVEDAELPYRPAVAVVPLGTGNDVARVFGWGKFFRLDSLAARLAAVERASIALVDRWDVAGSLPEGRDELVMSNYLSVGVDARAALLWARLAKRAPALFRLRLLNKLWYILCGTPEFFLHSYAHLRDCCEITCDGRTITLPERCEGLMILNTPSYGGGSDLWDEQRQAPLGARQRSLQTPIRPAAIDDGILEVVAVRNVIHLAMALGGFSNGIRLCQGEEITVRVSEKGVPLQIDGEPFNVPGEPSEPFDFSLKRRGDSLMLSAPQEGSGNGGSGAAEAAIERATGSGLISAEQREALLLSLARGR